MLTICVYNTHLSTEPPSKTGFHAILLDVPREFKPVFLYHAYSREGEHSAADPVFVRLKAAAPGSFYCSSCQWQTLGPRLRKEKKSTQLKASAQQLGRGEDGEERALSRLAVFISAFSFFFFFLFFWFSVA